MSENWINWFENLARCEKCAAPLMVSSLPNDPWQYNQNTLKWEHDCAKVKYRPPIQKLEVIETYSKSKYTTTFNGKNIEDLSKEDRKEIFHYLLKRIKESYPDGDADLMYLVNIFQCEFKDFNDVENRNKPTTFSSSWRI